MSQQRGRGWRREKTGWLVDVLVIIGGLLAVSRATWANDTGSWKGEWIMTVKVAIVGPAVKDIRLEPKQESQRGDKADCRATVRPGGGVCNVARQVRGLGTESTAVLMTGPAGIDGEFSQAVEAELGSVLPWGCMERQRFSVLLGDKCYTVRAAVANTSVPPEVARLVNEAAWTVIAPLTANDARLTAKLLRLAHRTVLQLSNDQLSQRASALALMAAADVTVLNQAEVEHLTGLADPQAAMQQLREHGVRNIVVTGAAGVLALIDGDWFWQPSYRVVVRQTIGAGDVFVGTLAAGLASGLSWKENLALAAAAAALHISGNVAADQAAIDRLIESSASNTTTIPSELAPAPASRTVRRLATATAAALLLVAVGLTTWLSV